MFNDVLYKDLCHIESTAFRENGDRYTVREERVMCCIAAGSSVYCDENNNNRKQLQILRKTPDPWRELSGWVQPCQNASRHIYRYICKYKTRDADSLDQNGAGAALHVWAHDERAALSQHGPFGAAGGVGEGNRRVGLGDRHRWPVSAGVVGARNNPRGKRPVEDQGQERFALGEAVAMVEHAVAQGGGPCTVPLVDSVDEVVRGAVDVDVVWLRIRNHGEANVHAGVDQGAIGAIDIPPNGVFGGAGVVEAPGVDLVEVVLDDPVAAFPRAFDAAGGLLLVVKSRLAVDVLERESEERLGGRMWVLTVQDGLGCVRDSRKLGLVGVENFQMVYAPRNEGLELGDGNVGREREVGAHLGRGDGGGKSVGGLFK